MSWADQSLVRQLAEMAKLLLQVYLYLYTPKLPKSHAELVATWQRDQNGSCSVAGLPGKHIS